MSMPSSSGGNAQMTLPHRITTNNGVSECMIFERSVEEPHHLLHPSGSVPNSAFSSRRGSFVSLCSSATQRKYSTSSNNSISSSTNMDTNYNSSALPRSSTIHHHHRHHRTMENLVAPALDASCPVVNDKNTNLNNVDMVCIPRPPSTMGLDMALGRTKSYSLASSPSPPSSNQYLSLSKSYSYNTSTTTNSSSSSSFTARTTATTPPPSSPEFGRILKFYSYADMVTEERNNMSTSPPSKPRMPQSMPSPFIKQQPTPKNPTIKNIHSNHGLTAAAAATLSNSDASSFSTRRDSAPSIFQHAPKKHPASILSRTNETYTDYNDRSRDLKQPVGHHICLSATTSNISTTATGTAAVPAERTKFHIDSSGSDGDSSDEDRI